MQWRAAIALALVAVVACAEDTGTNAPPAPPSDAQSRPPIVGGGGGGGGGADGGVVFDGGGGGGDDLAPGFLSRCITLDPTDAANQFDFAGATDEPIDFLPDRAFVVFDPSRCPTPAMQITFAQGTCTPGIGQRLVFTVRDPEFFETGSRRVAPFDTAMDIRFFIPGTPERTFGNCDLTDGLIDFTDVGTAAGDPLRARFDASLTDCAGLDVTPIDVTGQFDVTLGRSALDGCRAP